MSEALSPAGLIYQPIQAIVTPGTQPPTGVVRQQLRGSVVQYVGTNPGRFPLTGVTGKRGTIDFAVTLGATGSLRSLVTLINTTTNRQLTIGLGTDNRLQVTHQDDFAVLRADVTNGFSTDVAAGSVAVFRYIWDSTAPVDGLNYSAFWKNGVKATITSNSSAWQAFVPNRIEVGAAIGSQADFNGSIQYLQVSDTPVPWAG